MASSTKALIALAIAPNIAWVGFIAGLGVWRTMHGETVMARGAGPGLVGIGVFLAIACPVLASYLRPLAARA
jgi:hypothetical protein